MKRLVLMMTLLAWGMSEDVVPPKEVEAGDSPPKYWEKDMHPTPAVYDGDWSKGAPKIFRGGPLPKVGVDVKVDIHVEKTTEKENVKNWKVINPDSQKRTVGITDDGFYRLLGNVIIDGKKVEYWRVYTIKGGYGTGWFMEYWKETGLIKQKWFMVKNKAEGWFYKYHPNGQVALKYWSKNGKAEGWLYKYHPNGQVDRKYWCKNGKAEGWSYDYHPNGQLKEKFWEKNGKADGWGYEYYPDGVLKGKHFSANKALNGKHFVFYPTGELYKETDRVAGNAEGWEITYYKNGNIHFKAHFHEGFEDGNVETFKEDGNPSGKLPIGKMLDRGAIKKK